MTLVAFIDMESLVTVSVKSLAKLTVILVLRTGEAEVGLIDNDLLASTLRVKLNELVTV